MLIGIAKTHYYNWYHSKYNTIKFYEDDNIEDIFNILEWFESVGIYISVTPILEVESYEDTPIGVLWCSHIVTYPESIDTDDYEESFKYFDNKIDAFKNGFIMGCKFFNEKIVK